MEKAKLIVALDVDTLEETRKLIDLLSPVVDIFKVGNQLFTSCGPAAARFVLARGKKVFLDLKFHDIPNTVGSAVKSAVVLSEAVALGAKGKTSEGIFMLTVHTVGGRAMLEAAVAAAREKAEEHHLKRSLVVGITVLTSDEKNDRLLDLVLERAELAKKSGCDGVVASVEEAKAIRQRFGEDFIIVTPGIRPSGSDIGDQKRVATPKLAVESGSNFLVVGRPIVVSADPLGSAKKILDEIASAV